MRRFLFVVAALGLGLAAGTAEAGHPHPAGKPGGKPGGGHPVMHTTKHPKAAFKKGVKFKVKGSFIWRYKCWDARYLCFLFLCPDDGIYYYWCEPDDCYYPINFCPYGVYAW